MIKKIKIPKGYRTIPDNFELPLSNFTVVTGENNSGKTNFIKAVAGEAKVKKELVVEFLDENDKPLTPKIVYIAAENIQPAEDEAKFSAKTTGLVKNLSRLFSNLERKFKLEKQSEIIGDIQNLIEKADENLKNFNGKDEHALKIELNTEELEKSTIIQALIKNISGLENGVERELDDLGQGTQRIIVASILKAYADILSEKNIHTENSVLILFEEPEIYLHPKLKRTLNATLEIISGQPNHQVVITTHDPYFAFKNLEGKEKSIWSFKKGEKGMTIKSDEGIIDGIEDELLFVFLYNLLEKRSKDPIKIDIEKFEKRKYFDNQNKNGKDLHDLKYIRDQVYHFGANSCTLGLVPEKPKNCDGKNYYTEKELANAIRKMSEMLGT